MIDDDAKADYARDGVCVLRGAFAPAWIETVAEGVRQALDAPGPHGERYGPAGAERFLDTTTGWATPVLDDRAQPVYPRAQTLTAEERAFVDDALVRLGARITA